MTQSGILLNVGCGLDGSDRWRNVDASPSLRLARIPIVGGILLASGRIPPWPKSARYGDIVKGLGLLPSSCELIFASHVLEHLGRKQAQAALRNLHIYLRRGGVLRVIVPDLGAIARRYMSSTESSAADFFMTESGLGCEDRGLTARLREAVGNARHQWMWDEHSMKTLLVETGFDSIMRRGPTEAFDVRFFEVERTERHGDAICLEAVK